MSKKVTRTTRNDDPATKTVVPQVTSKNATPAEPKSEKKATKKLSPYTVTVTAKILSCRKSHSNTSIISGYVYAGEKLQIVEEHTDSSNTVWGRPKANIGWINLSFCEKAGY